MTRRCVILIAIAALLLWAWMAARPAPVVEQVRAAESPVAESRETRVVPIPAPKPVIAMTVRDVAPEPLRRIGRVLDAVTLAPIAEARVAICDASLEPISDEVRSSVDGTFRVTSNDPSVPRDLAGSLLFVTHLEYRVHAQAVPTVPMTTDGAFEVRLNARLEVRGSTKLVDGAPVVAARISLTRKRKHESTPPTPMHYPRVSRKQ